MSVYGQSKTEMDDIDILAEACDRLGLYYWRGENLSYYKWGGYWEFRPDKHGAYRGNGAELVIESLDTERWGTGQTAFIREPDGKLRAEIDTNWGNATINWKRLKAEYKAIMYEKQAARMGLTVQREELAPGKLRLRLVPERGAARTPAVRAPMARPTAQRGGAR